MCGIAGIVSSAGLAPTWPDDLATIDRSIRHRGPDDHGYMTDTQRVRRPQHLPVAGSAATATPRIAFVHRRLSIIDLSEAARQPMVVDDGRVFITYNGEVYNYRELRDELRTLGVTFTTTSDTEVVLAAYAQWGIEAVAKLRGIFAFAIADTAKQRVYFVRDHLGVKPLYYANVSGRWVFSSELKTFAALGVGGGADLSAIRKYLRFLWIPGVETGLQAVRKLEGGTWLELDLVTGSHRIHRYWDPITRAFCTDRRESPAEARAYLCSELERIVREQMVSDVPLGAFLSGGLDSSLVVALMARMNRDAVATYTVGYSRTDLAYDIVPDDLPYAREVSQMFGTRSTEIELSPDVATLLPKIVETLDEPLGDPAAISAYLICEAAKKKLTVMLSGVGADEIFGGYPRQRALLYGEMFRRAPAPFRAGFRRLVATLPAAGKGTLPKLGRSAHKFLGTVDGGAFAHYVGMETYFSPTLQDRTLASDGPLAHASDPVDDEIAALERRIEAACPGDPLKQSIAWDLVTYLPNLNLAYMDRTSMAHGIEVRVPFLDVRLVEWALGLRSAQQIAWRRGKLEGKHLLKEAAAAYLPEPIIWRKKAGFGAPVRSWLRNDLQEMRNDLLFGSRGLVARGWLDAAGGRALVDDFLSGRADYSLQIWMLMSLELWARRFVDAN
jgi:asparagine synthase (glutamine-hydrolysing)